MILATVQQQIALAHPKESLLPSKEFKCRYLYSLTEALLYQRTRLLNPLCQNKQYEPLIKKIISFQEGCWHSHSRWENTHANASDKQEILHKDVILLHESNKKNPLLSLLASEIEMIHQTIPLCGRNKKAKDGFVELTVEVRRRIFHGNLRPFQHTAFRMWLAEGIISKGREREGTIKDPKKKKTGLSFELSADITPEAIADDPQFIVRHLSISNFLNMPYEGKEKNIFSDEDTRDILFLVTENTSIRQMMGLLQNKPHLLDSPDVRALCYHIAFDRIGEKENPSFKEEGVFDPTIVEQFPSWLGKQIANNISQGKIERALFLIELNHRWERECKKQEDPKLQRGAKNATNYLSQLETWAQSSLDPKNPLAEHRNAIWKEWIHHYVDKEQLSASDIERVTLARFVFQGTASDPYNTTPTREEEIHRVLESWREPIDTALRESPDLEKAILMQVTEYLGVPFPKEGNWKKKGSCYRIGDYSLDLGRGTLICHADGTTNHP